MSIIHFRFCLIVENYESHINFLYKMRHIDARGWDTITNDVFKVRRYRIS